MSGFIGLTIFIIFQKLRRNIHRSNIIPSNSYAALTLYIYQSKINRAQIYLYIGLCTTTTHVLKERERLEFYVFFLGPYNVRECVRVYYAHSIRKANNVWIEWLNEIMQSEFFVCGMFPQLPLNPHSYSSRSSKEIRYERRWDWDTEMQRVIKIADTRSWSLMTFLIEFGCQWWC